jgi:NAD(P)-dependent dehydrogenase (short-subunit alcohol dehydrogenase family)
MMDVAGAVIVVTGAGSGIGRATAHLLHERGATCVLVDRDEVAGEAVAAEIGGTFVKADVADEEEVTRAVAAAVERGSLRGLINAAGIGRGARTVDRDGVPHSLKEFEFVLRVNLVGTFNCLRIAGTAMSKTDPVDEAGTRGAIVNVASVAAFDGQIGQAAYAASKGGVVSMTLPIARDLATVGIRVNTVAPGLVDTPIYGTGDRAEAFKAKLGNSVLFPNRLGHADEVASMIVELLQNDYMNGEVIRVDGGIRMPPR